MKHQITWIALGAWLACQAAAAQTSEGNKLERVEVTGTLIKRLDRETPSVVQTISREDIKNSGYATVEELLRANSAVDTGSVADGSGTGFVSGLSTISLRGFGSQGTLVLINGRRIAPVAAVDSNFGRGSLISVNTIPKGAIERVDLLKDGASSMYGSDAMAGVVNYVLRKSYEGVQGDASYSANDKGVGATRNAGMTFGFGNLAQQRFNVFGGFEVSKRDQVMAADLKDRGNLDLFNNFIRSTTLSGSQEAFTPNSANALNANYYRLPSSFSQRDPATGRTSTSTLINGISVANNSPSGVMYLGTLPGCPDANTVGKGVAVRPDGFVDGVTPSLRTGSCRFNLDNADEVISEQDRANGMVRATFAITPDLTAYADLMYSRTRTTEQRVPQTVTTSLVTSGARTGSTWMTPKGPRSTDAIILPVGHRDNPTKEAIQLLYRFEDLPTETVSDLKALRATAGLEGHAWGWDFDAALLLSRQDSERVQKGRLRKSLLENSIAKQIYRFGQINTPEAIASVASDAVYTGRSDITSLDLRGSRPWFQLPGGEAAVALGAEFRREKLSADPDPASRDGDFIGLVANPAQGSRSLWAAYSELSLPLHKRLEVQAALRTEQYSDFGNATTGKLGFKWVAVPSVLMFRGTGATGFRAPSIQQIGDGYTMSFHTNSTRRVMDPLRCDMTDPSKPKSKADPAVARDCNVLGYTTGLSTSERSGSIATLTLTNSALKPETSRSFTLGAVLSPTRSVDLALDAWYFERNGEVRSQQPIDLVDAFNKDPSGAIAAQFTRDANPATWLPGVPNSGPIIAINRKLQNFNWTKTAGLDYDMNVRFPDLSWGRFSLKLQGTYTQRFDQLILDGGVVDRYAGQSGTPKSKASLTLNWKLNDWSAWLRRNHTDAMDGQVCATTNTKALDFLTAYDRCYIGKEKTIDVGMSYRGFKGLTVAASVLNLFNDYNTSNGIPVVFNHVGFDGGATSLLGRRISVNVGYQFK